MDFGISMLIPVAIAGAGAVLVVLDGYFEEKRFLKLYNVTKEEWKAAQDGDKPDQ